MSDDEDFVLDDQEQREHEKSEWKRSFVLYPRFEEDYYKKTKVIILPHNCILSYFEQVLTQKIHRQMTEPLYVDDVLTFKVRLKFMNPPLFSCISHNKEEATLLYPDLFSLSLWEKKTKTNILIIDSIKCSLKSTVGVFEGSYKIKETDFIDT